MAPLNIKDALKMKPTHFWYLMLYNKNKHELTLVLFPSPDSEEQPKERIFLFQEVGDLSSGPQPTSDNLYDIPKVPFWASIASSAKMGFTIPH